MNCSLTTFHLILHHDFILTSTGTNVNDCRSWRVCSFFSFRMEMAEYFWEIADDSVSSAIAASNMFTQMARRTDDHEDVIEFTKSAK